jgi:hypothetical protein
VVQVGIHRRCLNDLDQLGFTGYHNLIHNKSPL